ncbi:hypothetical protein EOD42_14415 [Rhodovarius crocodyli]|uniref:Uncharacterized protein n=1 Tax=Rhodovarius crocodyli TaxID=1979269 RepID=A0A437MF60_9PROT|nr:hypothetical protein [Rhodovarius crocodyli]RVT96301.1 hypothetical protein EOD42_14415 [Rhodovarius crocodyli]
MSVMIRTAAVEAMIGRAAARMSGAAQVARELGSDAMAAGYENSMAFIQAEMAALLDSIAPLARTTELPLLAAPDGTPAHSADAVAPGSRKPHVRTDVGNAGCHWQDGEREQLREGWLAGKSIPALGVELKRSERAILHEATKVLGLERRPGDREAMRAFRARLAEPTAEAAHG